VTGFVDTTIKLWVDFKCGVFFDRLVVSIALKQELCSLQLPMKIIV